jgi:hypothetical protein
MAVGERRAWLEAAFAALRHLPIDVIEKGCAEALRKADHPSKIVPIITAMAEPEIAWRRRNAAPRPAPEPALVAPGAERPVASEIDAICKQFAVGRYARATAGNAHSPSSIPNTADPDRHCRAPSREDYIRLFGIDPEAKPASDDRAAA